MSASKQSHSFIDSAIAIGLLVVLVFSAAAFGSVESWSIAIVESLIAILAALWVIKWILQRQILIRLPAPTWFLIGLLLWGLVQTLPLGLGSGPRGTLSLDPGSTRVSLQVIFFLTLAFIMASNFFNNRRRYEQLAAFFSIYVFVMAVFALIQHFAWTGSYYWLRPSEIEGFGPFANRDHFAGYMEMLAPIPLALVITRAVHRQKRALLTFASIVAVIAGVASLSRGGILSITVEAVFLAFLGLRLRARERSARAINPRFDYLARAGTAIAIVGAVTLGLLWIGAEPLLGRAAETLQQMQNQKNNYVSRQWIWHDTVSLIKSHPINGTGLGTFRTVFPVYSHNNGELIVSQSHNDYLQILADCGIVGGLLAVGFLATVVFTISIALKSRDRLLAGLALGCTTGILGILLHSVFDFNLQIPSNALLFLFLVAVVSSIATTGRDHPEAAEN